MHSLGCSAGWAVTGAEGAGPGRGWLLSGLIISWTRSEKLDPSPRFSYKLRSLRSSAYSHLINKKDRESLSSRVGSSGLLCLFMLLAFLDQCGSLNSLGRFTWSQSSSVQVQSLWRDATSVLVNRLGCWLGGCQGFQKWGELGAGVPLMTEADP